MRLENVKDSSYSVLAEGENQLKPGLQDHGRKRSRQTTPHSRSSELSDSPELTTCMINNFISFWRATPRPALLGLLLFFCAGFADGALVPFFPLWAKQAGIPVGAIGLLFACYAGGEVMATPLIGGIADRVGRRPVLIVSSLGVGTGIASLFFVHGVVLTAAVLLLTGVCESVLHPTIFTVIADVTPPAAHRREFSLAQVSASAGQVLGPGVGALFALLSLRAVFLAAGAILLLGGW
jgi:DHA1 family tetracycline resistance protein-like MFS transporter